ncbi:hypothetical protein Krac_5934 [Ktedonobacter racemifer DSM 44963]|uniref:Uncharacterized protein n=1 Tax=Ktedonobacter racemifer DSM 44963 TaxID=485913 RepID=D6TX91_KTERA|nr:hypothetical protein Krac_5934 [Ktedonobacter racemifer DSM 44963]
MGSFAHVHLAQIVCMLPIRVEAAYLHFSDERPLKNEYLAMTLIAISTLTGSVTTQRQSDNAPTLSQLLVDYSCN